VLSYSAGVKGPTRLRACHRHCRLPCLLTVKSSESFHSSLRISGTWQPALFLVRSEL